MRKEPFIILRVFTSLIFIYASTNHFFQQDKIFGKLSKTAAYQFVQNESLFQVSILLSGIAMLIGGIALIAGYKKKLAATVLLVMLIPITLTVQLDNLNDLGPFFKNVAIAGSLLFIINYKSNYSSLIINPMNLKHLLFAVTTILISTIGFSQSSVKSKKDNLLFLLRQPEHINQALKTIEQLQAQPKTTLNAGKVVIIVCGEAVTSLTTKEAAAWVEKINKYSNVSLMACGLSLTKFNKTQNDLLKGIDYTENGFIKAFELQKQGYLSVEL